MKVAKSRAESPATLASASACHKSDTQALAAAVIRNVVATLENEMTLAEVVQFLTNVAVSSQNERVHSANTASSYNATSPSASRDDRAQKPKKRVRSASKREALRLKRIQYFASKKADRVRERGAKQAAPEPVPLASNADDAPSTAAPPLDLELGELAKQVVEPAQLSLESALEVSASEFASPPRGAPRSIANRVPTPQRIEFSDFQRLNPKARPFKPTSAPQIAFVKRHLTANVIASPRFLEQLVGELELLSESDWPAHLAAKGGFYSPPFGMMQPVAQFVGISPRRGDSQLKRRMSP